MVRKLVILFLLCAGAGALLAQTTAVTAQINDPSGTSWINAPCAATWVGQGTPSTTTGGTVNTKPTCTVNSSGAMSVTVADVASIAPANTSSWQFCVSPVIAPTQQFCVVVAATGASQSITSQIQAVLVAPSITGGPLAQAYADSEVSAVAGNQYFNITTNVFRCYTTTWVACAIGGGGGSGTVTSVALKSATPNLFSGTAGTAVTTSGTLDPDAQLLTQSANCVIAGPATGSTAQPTCRALVSADFPGTLAPTFSAANLTSIPACATCVVASSPGVGLAHFAGSTQTVTSSLVNLTSATDVTGALPAANVVTGTSGAAIPLLNGNNTYGGTATFQTTFTIQNGINVTTTANNTATVSACHTAGTFVSTGDYWTGSGSAADTWSIAPTCTVGTNGARQVAIANTAGSTGSFAVNIGNKANDITTFKSVGQGAASDFAGTCAMAGTTSCTITIGHTYATPVCIATQQSATLTGGAVGCTVSGTTVTITSAVLNSETWGALVFGNPT